MPDRPLTQAGTIYLNRQDDQVRALRLRLPEPEAAATRWLCGRDFSEVPALVQGIESWSRVPAALSACRAVELAVGATLDPELAMLRRLLACADWIRSHSRHIYTFQAVCLMGFPSLIAMGRAYPAAVNRARRLARLGGDLLNAVAGPRLAHLRVGGFSQLPEARALRALEPALEWARQAATDTISLLSRIPFPRFDRDYRFLALDAADISGSLQLATAHGVRPLAALEPMLEQDGACHVGPLARYALLRPQLPSAVIASSKLGRECRNPFKSVTVRASELAWAVDEALAIIRGYRVPARPAVAVQPRAGAGCGGAEGALGLWSVAIELDGEGKVRNARIFTPSSINRRAMERDLLDYLRLRARPEQHDHLLLKEAGQLLGNYDPSLFQRLQLVEPETSDL